MSIITPDPCETRRTGTPRCGGLVEHGAHHRPAPRRTGSRSGSGGRRRSAGRSSGPERARTRPDRSAGRARLGRARCSIRNSSTWSSSSRAPLALAARPVERGRPVVGGEHVDQRRRVGAVRLLRQAAEEREDLLAPRERACHRALAGHDPRGVAREDVAQREAALLRERVEDAADERFVLSAPQAARLPAVDQALDVPPLGLAEVDRGRRRRRASSGSSFATAASRRSRSGVGCRSCRRSQRRRLTVSWSTGCRHREELRLELVQTDRANTLLAIASRRDERRQRCPRAARRDDARRPAARRRPALAGSSKQRAAVDVRRRRPSAARVERLGRGRLRARRTSAAPASSSRSWSGGRGPCSSTRAAQPRACSSRRGPKGSPRARTESSDADLARAALDLDEEERPVIVLSFGLPERPRDPERHTAAEWSARANRKPIDEVVRWVS